MYSYDEKGFLKILFLKICYIFCVNILEILDNPNIHLLTSIYKVCMYPTILINMIYKTYTENEFFKYRKKNKVLIFYFYTLINGLAQERLILAEQLYFLVQERKSCFLFLGYSLMLAISSLYSGSHTRPPTFFKR